MDGYYDIAKQGPPAEDRRQGMRADGSLESQLSAAKEEIRELRDELDEMKSLQLATIESGTNVRRMHGLYTYHSRLIT